MHGTGASMRRNAEYRAGELCRASLRMIDVGRRAPGQRGLELRLVAMIRHDEDRAAALRRASRTAAAARSTAHAPVVAPSCSADRLGRRVERTAPALIEALHQRGIRARARRPPTHGSRRRRRRRRALRRRARPSRRAPCAWGSPGAGCRWPILRRGRRPGGPARTAPASAPASSETTASTSESGRSAASASPSSTTYASTTRPALRSGTRTRTPGRHVRGQLLRDRVVEEAIELRQRRVDQDARDAPRGHVTAPREAARVMCPAGGGAGHSPAAARRSSTRSVRSQVKSGSSRPKCP